MIADIIVLCKDNSDELIATLDSCCCLITHPSCQYHVTILDSSSDFDLIHRIYSDFVNTTSKVSFSLIRQYPPSGIYSAMNYAVKLSFSDCLIFMNSGDTFFDTFSLAKLIDNYLFHIASNSMFKGCFGIANISAYSNSLRWSVPPSDPRLIFNWLSFYYPCHQSILFSTQWAKSNLYPTHRTIDADSVVIKAFLSDPACFSFVSHTVCNFNLNGVSSMPLRLSKLFSASFILSSPSYFCRQLLKYILSPAFLPFNLLPFWTYLRHRFTLLLFYIFSIP